MNIEDLNEEELEAYQEYIYEIIAKFGEGLNPDADLDASYAGFVEHFDIDEEDAEVAQQVIVDAFNAEQDELDESDDDCVSYDGTEDMAEKVTMFLKKIFGTMPSPDKPFFNFNVADKKDVYGNVRGNQTTTAKYLGRDNVGTEQPSNSLRTSRRPVVSESISNPNSSGQGFDPSHKQHPLVKVITNHGYSYSHTTPITQRSGDKYMHHTFEKGQPKVGVNDQNQSWVTKVSSASGHSHSGVGAVALDKHLANKAKRYAESYVLPSTPIQEGLLQPLNPAYLKAAQKFNSVFGESLKGGEFTANPAKEFRETQRLIDERKKKFEEDQGRGGINMPSFIDRKR